jgi:hypothetical protein
MMTANFSSVYQVCKLELKLELDLKPRLGVSGDYLQEGSTEQAARARF